MLSLLAAEFRLAKRPAQRVVGDLLGLDVSLGMIANLEGQTATAPEPVDAKSAEAVRLGPWALIDETRWRQANRKAWLWFSRTDRATHLRIGPRRDADTARAILGAGPDEVVICDRFGASGWVQKKQWRWAHLRGDFQAMIDRDDSGSTVGSRLLKLSDALSWGWHRLADGELSWDDFLRRAESIRVRVLDELRMGASGPSRKLAATCRHLLGSEEHLWRFLTGDGAEPTNNSAGRALRHGGLWRKSTGGPASERRSRFVSRMLGVVETCRQQGHSVLDFLTACFEASLRSQPVPSLVRPSAGRSASWAEDAP